MKKVYPDYGHAEGVGIVPWYRLEEGKFYPDYGHPQGEQSKSWFMLIGDKV
ncbi:MAG: hypothetical protein GTO40_14460, partial [Deltaproteobacteria bacterium]|nr:hypothetical protein [Deltaproteobacteria bacterium]